MIRLKFDLDSSEDVVRVRRLIKADDLCFAFRDFLRILKKHDDYEIELTANKVREDFIGCILDRGINLEDLEE